MSRGVSRLVALVGPRAQPLATPCAEAGLEVVRVESAEQLCRSRAPQAAALVVDLDCLQHHPELAERLRQRFSDVPVHILAEQAGMADRLLAARAGSTRFWPLGDGLAELAGEIDRELVASCPLEPYRVLVFDHDREEGERFGAMLAEAGMAVVLESDPLAMAEALTSSAPELALVATDTPGCDGIEVALVIRQFGDWTDLPIVLVADRITESHRLGAVAAGGAGFLARPFDAATLISSVQVRIRRARQHRATHQQLQNSLAELQRQRFALDQHAIVSVTDVSGRITYVNDKFCQISRYSREELIGNNHRLLKSDEQPDAFFEAMWETISQGRVWHGEIRNRAKDGSHYWVETTIVPFLDGAGLPERYVSMRTEITRVKNAELAMRRARDTSERANRAKGEFLSRMSHELRTPLNAILGFAQILESDQTAPLSEEQLEHVRQISHAGWHLLEMINEVLDLSRIEAGGISVTLVPTALAPLIEQCIALMRPLADQRGIEIDNRIDPNDGSRVVADAARLRQVVINLLSNAIKYNRQDGRIVLDSGADDLGRTWLAVSDTGCGIPLERMDELFQPFNRLGADASGVEGSGVGLALTKRLVELMQGEIRVESVPGEGATFTVELNAP